MICFDEDDDHVHGIKSMRKLIIAMCLLANLHVLYGMGESRRNSADESALLPTPYLAHEREVTDAEEAARQGDYKKAADIYKKISIEKGRNSRQFIAASIMIEHRLKQYEGLVPKSEQATLVLSDLRVAYEPQIEALRDVLKKLGASHRINELLR